MDVMRRFLLLSLIFIGGANSQNLEEASTYFASTDHDVYLDWLQSNQASYGSSVFLPSRDGPENGSAVHWSIRDEKIFLAVATRATGWSGFGIAESGAMKGADMVLFTAATNELTDAHVLDDFAAGPIEDDCQSWTLLNSQTEGGFLIFEAVRLLDTQDPQDRPIVFDGTMNIPPSRIIAAWGDSPTVSYHEPSSRARSSIRFYGTSSGVEDELAFERIMDVESEGTIELRAKDHPVKQVDTEYAKFCFSLSDLVNQGMPSDEELHIIGIEPVIDPDAAKYVHHLIVYGEEQDWQGQTADECENSFWFTMASGWAPGEGPFSLPPNVGGPLGKNGFVSFQLEIHYNNPTLDTGVLDSSGVRFHFTSQKRQYDLGVLQLGDPILRLEGISTGSPNALNQHNFDCPSSCSSLALGGSEEVTVVREYLHMHESGVRMYNRQIRNGEVIHDGFVEFFDFDQQGSFAVQQEAYVVQPNDSFETSCTYKTVDEERQFGISSQEEMCMAFLFYYPRKKLDFGSFGIFPFVCGYDTIPGCSSSWIETQLEGPTELERTFGAPADVCLLPQDSNTTNPASPTQAPTTPTASTTQAPTTPTPATSSSGRSGYVLTPLVFIFSFLFPFRIHILA